MNFFNKTKLTTLILVILLFPYSVFAQVNTCSPVGYSIYTINGINTTIDEAKNNRRDLERKLMLTTYNNQPVNVDFLYNATHLAGAGDIIDSIREGFFDEHSDYDLTNMLSDASNKITTQKVLLVAHSQGNFYANNFYTTVVDQSGGVPAESLGVYSVATPASYVAGGGKWLTSNTDTVIAKVVGRVLNILPPNTHIDFQPSDDSGLGHDFSNVYLKYQGDKIVSDIEFSLDKLRTNNIQDVAQPCISPPKIGLVHKIETVGLIVADPIAILAKASVVGVYNIDKAIVMGIFSVGGKIASLVDNLAGKNSAAVALSDNTNSVSDQSNVQSAPDNSSTSSSIPIQKINSTPTTNSPLTIILPTPKVSALQNPISTVVDLSKVLPPPIQAATTLGNISTTTTLATSINFGNVVDPYANVLGSGGGGGAPASTPDPVVVPPDPTPPAPLVPVADTTAPVITILGKNPLTILLNSAYHDAGATALDDVDGAVSVQTSGTVDTSTIGAYNITYTVTDSAGNTSTATRVINVNALNTNFLANSPGAPVTDIINIEWTLADSPVIVTGEFHVPIFRSLTIDPGVVVKFADANSYIFVQGGTLKAEGTATDKIYLTSIKDDTVGGDTNADGNATAPSAGDWRGIYMEGGDPTYVSSLSNVVVRYAGAASYPGIYTIDQNVSIADSVIDDNGSIGLYENHGFIFGSTLSVSGTDISNQDYGIYMDAGTGPEILTITNSAIHNNYIYGAFTPRENAFDASNNYWGDPSGPNADDGTNPSGLGDRVSNHITFTPFLTSSPI
jgi:hypothetical protein